MGCLFHVSDSLLRWLIVHGCDIHKLEQSLWNIGMHCSLITSHIWNALLESVLLSLLLLFPLAQKTLVYTLFWDVLEKVWQVSVITYSYEKRVQERSTMISTFFLATLTLVSWSAHQWGGLVPLSRTHRLWHIAEHFVLYRFSFS